MIRTKNKPRVSAFKLQPYSRKQRQLLSWWTVNSPYKDHDMVIAHGAIRSGKTIAMIDSFITWATSEHRNQNFILAGKTMGALKRNVINPLFQILASKNMKYEYRRSENPHIIIGTNTFYLFGASTEASQDTLQGLTAAGAYADEAALLPRSFIEQMIGRCSAETDGNGAKIFMNCNPAGPYHWFKQEFIDKAKEKMILVLHFMLDDNLTLSEKVKERYKRMFTGTFYKRYIRGLWVMAEGIIYDMFNEARHVLSRALLPDHYDTYYITVDYGTKNPAAFGLWGLSEGVWYKIKEYYYDGRERARQKTDAEYAEDLRAFAGSRWIKGVIVDPSAASFITVLEQEGWYVIEGDNDVLDGIRNVGTALSEDLVRYSEDCTETFREFASYVWDEKAAARGVDKPVKQNDHLLDADRYFIRTILFEGQAVISSENLW